MKKVYVKFSGSGVKTLRALSWIIFSISEFSAVMFLTNTAGYGNHFADFTYSISCFLFGIIFLVTSLVIAAIGENAVYQKAKLLAELGESETEIIIE